jgi:hypothetical protein
MEYYLAEQIEEGKLGKGIYHVWVEEICSDFGVET